jgi:hypothetical protein
MAKVVISESLYREISQKFRKESITVLEHLRTLEKHPKQGKIIGVVGDILVKELRYRGFRFYFLTDGFRIKLMDEESLSDLLLRFVRMSDKKRQQETIEEIKTVLRKIGPKGFD